MRTKGILTLLLAVICMGTVWAQSPNQGLKVGEQAVDFTLKDANGKTVQLYEQLKKGPVILKWYRGGWCPFCNLELKGLADRYEDIVGMGAELIALSPEMPDKALATAMRNEVAFPVLSDVDNRVGKLYDLVYALDEATATRYEESFQLSAYNGNQKAEVPLPATYIIDQTGKIRYAFVNTDYRKRAPVEEVLEQLAKIAKAGAQPE